MATICASPARYGCTAAECGAPSAERLSVGGARQLLLRSAPQDSAKIRNKKEYIELSTQKGGIFFTTPALKSLSDSYTELSNGYEKKQSELVKEVIAIVGTAAHRPQR